jgi:hypothetical protein
MNRFKSNTANAGLLVAVLILGAGVGKAGQASGDYAVAFEASPSLWDISGTYHQDLVNLAVDYTINVDPSGKFTGIGTGSFHDGPDYLEGAVSITGTLRAAGDVVRVNMTLKLNLLGEFEGTPTTFTATIKENLELDPASHQLVGTGNGKATVSVPGAGKQSASLPKLEIDTSLPVDATGSWDLALNLSANLNRYTGSSTVTLSSGRSFPLMATGSYGAKSDASRITLKGMDLNRAIRLSMTAYYTNGQMTVRKLSGKAFGQSLRFSTGP